MFHPHSCTSQAVAPGCLSAGRSDPAPRPPAAWLYWLGLLRVAPHAWDAATHAALALRAAGVDDKSSFPLQPCARCGLLSAFVTTAVRGAAASKRSGGGGGGNGGSRPAWHDRRASCHRYAQGTAHPSTTHRAEVHFGAWRALSRSDVASPSHTPVQQRDDGSLLVQTMPRVAALCCRYTQPHPPAHTHTHACVNIIDFL